jgi:hypothetical protein
VVNATRQLAVIPKGFHQPLTDFRGDAKIAATLRREMEEELFGRQDIDNTLCEQHAADPLHPSRLSAPMRWLLTENPAAFRMECTGFGLNLVSGNFEFACLIVIDSDEFWSRFGGQIEASWESSSLRQYSGRYTGYRLGGAAMRRELAHRECGRGRTRTARMDSRPFHRSIRRRPVKQRR